MRPAPPPLNAEKVLAIREIRNRMKWSIGLKEQIAFINVTSSAAPYPHISLDEL